MKKMEYREEKVVFDHPYESDFEVSPDKIVYVQSIQTYDSSIDELLITHHIYYIDWEGKLQYERFNFWGKWEEEKDYSDKNYWDNFIDQWKEESTLQILDLKPRRDYYPTNAERYIFNNKYIKKYENINNSNSKDLIIYFKIPNKQIKLSFKNDIDRYNAYQKLTTVEDHEPR